MDNKNVTTVEKKLFLLTTKGGMLMPLTQEQLDEARDIDNRREWDN